MTPRSKTIIVVWAVVLGLTAGFWAAAQTAEDVAARRARLEAELRIEEEEIARQTELLKAKQKDTATVQGEIDLLKSRIKRAEANIRAKRLAINQLKEDITTREGRLDDLTANIKRNQASLAELLRKTREVESFSLVEVALDQNRLSDFLNEAESLYEIQRALHRLFEEIRADQERVGSEKVALEDEKAREEDAQREIEYQKNIVAEREKEQQVLLSLNKTQEVLIGQIKSERERRAASIRSALFALRDTAAIPFGQALDYANEVSVKTGVRPAFLLAILTQESDLGENIGTCNRPGDPPAKGWRQVMKPSRDHAPFLAITAALGLDPDSMPVSCPWQGGWGGAMGPAQFIPSTWQLYAQKVASFAGKGAANPWEPRDAFMASGVYLSELGAAGGNFTAERTAALKYYAGSNWNKAKNAFYGNEVMAKAQKIQFEMINPLQNV